MDIVVTGAAGFLGAEVVAALLRRGELRGQEISRVVTVDRVAPAVEVDGAGPRLVPAVGDIADPDLLDAVVDQDTGVVFHLAAVVSGQAEVDHELGARVNVDGTRRLLEACRRAGSTPVVVFASSLAVYGGELPPVVDDVTPLWPSSTYGTQKAIGELLLADHTRKGFVDGRALRLPTICVRPGAPNRAASSFLSGIIREPLAGVPAVCPVPPETQVWLASPESAVANLVAGAEVDLGSDRRGVNLPGVSVSVGEMVQALAEAAGPEVAELVRWEPDPAVDAIVRTWPARTDISRAVAAGFRADAGFGDLLAAHLRRIGR
ncbi:D-erythronate dehydrogenase [Pseudonocardia sp. CA-107938]|uniref:D-erythronate dehydrogenase n=1 Tax=Pseudonocardia sp. CA-107938 TaxID=3240021 RepID=UPI003D8DB177